MQALVSWLLVISFVMFCSVLLINMKNNMFKHENLLDLQGDTIGYNSAEIKQNKNNLRNKKQLVENKSVQRKHRNANLQNNYSKKNRNYTNGSYKKNAKSYKELKKYNRISK